VLDPFAKPIATVRRFCRTCSVADVVDVPSEDEADYAVAAWMKVHGLHREGGYQVIPRDHHEAWKPTAAYIRWTLKHWDCCLAADPPRRPGLCDGERFSGPEPMPINRSKGGGPAAWGIWVDLRADVAIQLSLLSKIEREYANVVIKNELYSNAAHRLDCRVPDIKRGIADVVERIARKLRGLA
jgi:hypothetical protein